MPWEDLLDYRDSLLTRVRPDVLTSVYSFSASDSVTHEAQYDFLAVYPSLNAYELFAKHREEEEDQAVAWASQLITAFEHIHSAEGLFLFAFDTESMGLSAQRAEALTTSARYIGEKNSWLMSLSEIQRWWLARKDVSVRLNGDASEGFEILVNNTGKRHLAGVSLNFWYNSRAHGSMRVESDDLDITATTLDDKVVLVIQNLPAGQSAIRLSPVKTDTISMP